MALMVVSDSSEGWGDELTLSDGIVADLNGDTSSSVGTYSISGSTLTITLNAAKFINDFSFGDDD